MLLNNLKLFLHITEKGGLAAAGREMGLSPATVSERLVALEDHYRSRLLNRTTRSISLTEEGKQVAEGAKRILAEVEQLEDRLLQGVGKVSGPIRISAPQDLGRHRVAKILEEFLAEYPEVNIDLHLGDQRVDIVAEGLDLAIRCGRLADSTLMVQRLADNVRICCASPAYLERFGEPKHPKELSNHACLIMKFGRNIDNHWSFKINNQTETMLLQATRIANDGSVIRDWCLAGHGIAKKSQWDIAEDINEGRLVRILRKYETEPVALQVLYPKGRNQIRRIGLLIQKLRRSFA